MERHVVDENGMTEAPVSGRADATPSATMSTSFDSGRYSMLARLDQGGMAEVFLALQRGTAGVQKLVVIKRLRDNLAEDVAHRDMFLDEARLAARLSHANIVQTYEVADHDGTLVIAMEYLEGQPLSRVANQVGKNAVVVHPAVSARIVSEVLSGLEYAHEATDFDGEPLKIVHRDVSPQNIFLTYDGQVKLLDFGIAKAEMSLTKTQAGTFKGKVAYMAPEQLMGESSVDRRADIFTAGIVLWELLTGERLMSAGSTAATLMRVVNQAVPRVSTRVPGIDPKLDAIVAQALERNPDARYATAQAMHEALEAYIAQCGHAVQKEEIGGLVTKLFGELRVRVQQEIRAQIAQLPHGPDSGIMVSGTRSFSDVDRLGTSATPSGARSTIEAIGVRSAPPVTAPPRRWMTAAIALGVAALSSATFAIVSATLQKPTPEAAPVTAPAPESPPPTVTIAAAPTAPAPLSAAEPPSATASAAAAAAAAADPSTGAGAATPRTAAPVARPAPHAAWGGHASPKVAPPVTTPSTVQPAPQADHPPPPPPAAATTQAGRKYRTEL